MGLKGPPLNHHIQLCSSLDKVQLVLLLCRAGGIMFIKELWPVTLLMVEPTFLHTCIGDQHLV